jgi:hypothetical protein
MERNEENMATSSIDLAKLFGTVAKTMVQNQTSLNAADDYNHDHGDNMVEVFDVITRAMKERSTATPAQQLAYASQLLQQKTNSGSGKLYAENLADASAKLGNVKKVTPDTAMTLIQTLLGASDTIPAQNQQPAGGGLGGGLLDALLGGSSGSSSSQQTGAGSDLLGSLLGGLAGASSGGAQSGQQGQIDIGTLLNAGMAFAQAKKSGRSNLDSVLQAVVSSSKMNTSTARTQSGTLVANTLLQALGKMTAAK